MGNRAILVLIFSHLSLNRAGLAMGRAEVIKHLVGTATLVYVTV